MKSKYHRRAAQTSAPPIGLTRPVALVLLCLAVTVNLACPHTEVFDVRVQIQDDAVDHTHSVRSPFAIQLKLDYMNAADGVRYHWQDFRGQLLTQPQPLEPGEAVSIRAPNGQVGYLGLVLAPATRNLALPSRQPGEAREYGFAVLPPPRLANRRPNLRSRFGTIHSNVDDPYLQGWIKTMTWKTTSPKWWGMEMEKRRELGLLELPIVVGADWASDDLQPISRTQLSRLKSRIRQYFEAHPTTGFWETGIEENLRGRYEKPYYWHNLAAKLQVVRQAADAVNPDIRLIYQIAELRPRDVQAFLESKAVQYIDILSLHPYAWPDFPSPEEWLEGFVNETHDLMKARDIEMPIWFTEIGVPHHGNAPGEFFGYPEKGKRVSGCSPYQAVLYLIKIHAMAYHLGVEKLFWYNYRDRGPAREQAEDHFGLRDYWGYPKPAYVAYINLLELLSDKIPDYAGRLQDDIRVYSFRGEGETVVVAWAYPAAKRRIAVSGLLSNSSSLSPDTIRVVDPMGTPILTGESSIEISGEPVFIIGTPEP